MQGVAFLDVKQISKFQKYFFVILEITIVNEMYLRIFDIISNNLDFIETIYGEYIFENPWDNDFIFKAY